MCSYKLTHNGAVHTYWDNQLNYQKFRNVITNHTNLIKQLMVLNDKSDSIDFSVKIDAKQPLYVTSIRYTEEEKKEMYQKALANWGIFTYMTDTLVYSNNPHTPFGYQSNDPFGMDEWSNSQVVNLLASIDKKGNCFALTSLFKIFSERLNSGAEINIAPGHIYIQHQDHMGDWYNVELATGSHPSDGSIQTLTFTYLEGIKSGIALRRLDLKQDVALCLIYLAKSYEHKFGSKTDDFLLKCAELTLKYDDKNLNAQLLKHQVLAERVVNYSIEKGITEISKLSKDNEIASTYKELEKQTLLLYDLGYHQMPIEMQKTILAGLQHKNGDQPIIVENHTPNPFTTIDVAPEDKRYSTLSGGLFEEVHPIRKYETYRNFVLDTEERKLSKMNLNSENELLIDPVAFAWSIDPLAHEFPSWSPYVAFADNPIIYVDPNGKSVKPATTAAKQVFLTSIASLTNGDSEAAKSLFNLSETKEFFDNASNQTIFSTNDFGERGQKKFERRLRRLGLTDAQNEEAKAIFKVLQSEAIVELTVITESSLQIGNDINTEDPEKSLVENGSLRAIQRSENPAETTVEVMKEQNIKGRAGKGTFAFFSNNPRNPPSSANSRNLIGKLIINLFGETSTTGSTSITQTDINQGVREGLKNFKDQQSGN